MAGEEVYTGVVAGVIVVVIGIVTAVQISGAGNAPGGIPGIPEITLQIGAQGIPVAAVPFRPAPAGREFSYLVHASRIPGLRNQLHISQHGIRGQKLKERGIVQGGAVLVPPQNACKIKAEAVDPVAHRPVAQAFQNQKAHDGMITV